MNDAKIENAAARRWAPLAPVLEPQMDGLMTPEIRCLYRRLYWERRYYRSGCCTPRERRESRALQARLAIELHAASGRLSAEWTKRVHREVR